MKSYLSQVLLVIGLSLSAGLLFSSYKNTGKETLTELKANSPMEISEETLATEKVAFKLWSKGWDTGDFDGYIGMLSDDFTFSYPMGDHRGLYRGKEGKMHMIEKCREHTAANHRLTFIITNITSNSKGVVFEFDAAGKFGEYPYKGRNAIAFDITGDKISGFREYLGDIDPAMF